MGYEPELNDPVFYEVEGETEPIKCFRCSDELDADEIIWADVEGQILKEGNDTTWCESCLPNERELPKWITYTFICDPNECDSTLDFTAKDGFGFPNGEVKMTCPCGRKMIWITTDTKEASQ